MLTGSMTALVTPFRAGEIDRRALAALVERQIDAGTHGLVPCGSTGEAATLTHDEHLEVVREVVRLSRRRVPVIAGTGSNSTAEAIRLTRGAALGGHPRVRKRRDGGGEVEHDVLGAADRAEVATDRHAERRAAGHLARVAPHGAVPGGLERAGDREVGILARQRHQQPAHASRRPADDERDAVRQARTPGAPSRAWCACRCSRR